MINTGRDYSLQEIENFETRQQSTASQSDNKIYS